MGLGDWIMASSEAKELHEAHGKQVVFTDGDRVFYDRQVFANNPRVLERAEGDFLPILNYPSRRPYVAGFKPAQIVYRPEFRAKPGELFLTDEERSLRLPGRYAVVEPHVKRDPKFSTVGNKDWGWFNWQRLVKGLDMPLVQLGAGPFLEGVQEMPTRTFREALGVLSGASLVVTTDGALHHAAAALGLPAVVIWGGYSSPVNLGYETHLNLWDGVEPCGSYRFPCQHCKRALKAISVERVREAINTAWHAPLGKMYESYSRQPAHSPASLVLTT
jgi:hypothetical protein